MNEIRFYMSLIMRRVHWIILLGVLGAAAAVWYASSLPATYRAQVVLIAESGQIPDNMAPSTVRVGTTEQLQIIRQRVTTRDVLIDLANRLNVHASDIAATGRRLTGDEIVQDMRARLSISVGGGGRSGGVTQVTLSFTAPEAQMAADVANEVATLMLRENVEMRTATSRMTLEFFEGEVARLDQELASRSSDILDFQQENLSALPAAGDFTRNRLNTLEERLAQLEEREIDISDRRDVFVRLRELALADPGTAGTPATRELRDLTAERARVSITLSAEHPRVRMLDAQIARLEDAVAAQAAADPGESEPREARTEYDVRIADLDRQLAAIERQRPRVEDEIARLEQVMEVIPRNTVLLETLQREYRATQERYNQAVTNRARAQTGDTIETMSRGQRLSVVEPATAPRRPVSPNRELIVAGGTLGSLSLGIVLAGGLALLRPVIRRPEDLSTGLGITPFATLPYLRTEADIFRRRMAIWGGGATALVILGIGAWVLNSQVMPLDMIVQRMLARFG